MKWIQKEKSYKKWHPSSFKSKIITIEKLSILFDIDDFKFSMQQPPCSNVDLLVLVHTSPFNRHKRQIIRRTWANQTQNSKYGKYRVMFLIGQVPDNKLKQAELVFENSVHKDIIQGNFIDAYRNMTYKHVMGLKWHKYFCASAKIYLKVDDDIILNIPYILQTFKTPFWDSIKDENGDFIGCRLLSGNHLDRNPGAKYYVPVEQFAIEVYPDYCGGLAVFYANQSAIKLYDEYTKVPYLFIDDAYVTGLVRDRTTIKVTEFFPSYFNGNGITTADAILDKNFFVAAFDYNIFAFGENMWQNVLRANKFFGIDEMN